MKSFLETIWRPGDVREIRAFDAQEYPSFGYFDDPGKANKAIATLEKTHVIYVTMNPVNPEFINRVNNRIKKCVGRKDKSSPGQATKDTDIVELRYLLIDLDPKRISEVSSTSEELQHSKELAEQIIAVLGKPYVFGMSGNGYHLIYRHDAKDALQVKAYLAMLDNRYGQNGVSVDTGVFNPSRITKVLGATWARKGDNTEKRPWRKSILIEVNEDSPILSMPPVPAPEPKPEPAKIANKSNPACVRTYSEQIEYAKQSLAGINYTEKTEATKTFLILESCLFDHSHTGKDAAIVIGQDCKICYQCFHTSCKKANYTWDDAKRALGVQPRNRQPITCNRCGFSGEWRQLQSGKWVITTPDGTQHNCDGQPPVKHLSIVSPEEAAQEKEDARRLFVEDVSTSAFPIDCLPIKVASYCLEAAQEVGCPVDMVAVPMLAALGAAIGNGYRVIAKGNWSESTALYTAIVGTTTSKKTPALKTVSRFFADIETANKDENERMIAQYKIDRAQYKAAMKRFEKEAENGTPTGLAPVEPEEPKYKRFHVADATAESVAEIIENNPRGIIVMRDELSAWITGQNQYKGGKGSDKQFWLTAWSNASSPVDRKGKVPMYIKNPFVAVAGAITPGDVKLFTKAGGDGFIERILFANPDHVISGWSDSEIPMALANEMQELFTRLYNGNQSKNYRLSTSAKTRFVAWYNEHCERIKGAQKLIEGTLGKMPGQLLRIALILAVVDGTEEVEENQINDAIKIVNYFIKSARKVLSCVEADELTTELRALVEYAKKRGLSSVTARQLYVSRVCKNSTDAKKLLHSAGAKGLGILEKNTLTFVSELLKNDEK